MSKIKRSLQYLLSATDLCIDVAFSAISDKVIGRNFLSSFFPGDDPLFLDKNCFTT